MLILKGIVVGIKQINRVNQKTGEQITKNFLGIECDKSGGYDNEKVIYDLQISNRFVNEGKCALFEKLKGSDVALEVFPNPWAGKNGANITWFLGGTGEPLQLGK